MIQKTESYLDDFSKHFNSRFNLSDFLEAAPLMLEIVNGKADYNITFVLKLPCGQQTFLQLIDFGYHDLLKNIIKRVTVEKEANDVYCSKIYPETFEVYKLLLCEELKLIEVELDSTLPGFVIKCPRLTQELLWSPISQFHAEVSLQLDYFNKLIDIRCQTSDRTDAIKSIYINSKVPTPYSYFIIAFLAENLGIPLKL